MQNDLQLFEIKASNKEEALEIVKNQHGITENSHTIYVKELKESKKFLGFIDVKGLYEITAVEKQVENDVVTVAKKLLTMMDINLDVEITKSSEHFVLINLYGPDNGIIIGKKGKTLNSFEFLLNTLVKGCKVEVDVEGFKEKRANTLRDLARKMVKKLYKQIKLLN